MKIDFAIVKTLSCIISILFYCNLGFTQCNNGTIRQTGTGLHDVHVFSNGDIIACGQAGQIIKSKDGGKSWRGINSTNGSFSSIHSMSFVSDSLGFAVTSISHSILRTEDKGESWIPLYSAFDSYAYGDIYFINENVGFVATEAFDAQILKSTDGGKNWIKSYSGPEDITSVYFKNDSTGYAIGSSGFILMTVDTGKTWRPIPFPKDAGGRLSKITFVNENIGFAVGFWGAVFKTIDGGITWEKQIRLDSYLNDVLFLDQNIGFVIGGDPFGSIWKTSDGGNTWKKTNIGISGTLNSIAVDQATKKLIIVGSQTQGTIVGGRYILTSVDEGENWDTESNNYSYELFASHYLSEDAVFIAGAEGEIYKSKDKGESWKQLNFNSQGPIVSGLFFVDESRGFLFNNKDLYNGDEIYETSDGGNTWIRNSFPDGPENFNSRGWKIFFWNPSMGVAINSRGIFKTTDGGKSWSIKKGAFTEPFADMFKDGSFQSNGVGYAITLLGKLLKTIDFGETWEQIDLNNVNEVFLTVHVVNDSIAFIGGNNGLMYKTTNAGRTWIRSANGFGGFNIESFYFLDPSTGYASCNYGNGSGNGDVYRTRDSGNTWVSMMQFGENRKISGYKNDFVIVGRHGKILKNDIESAPVTGYIGGPIKACLNDKVNYGTAQIATNSYEWQLSGGGAAAFAKNTATIQWTSTGQHALSLTAINDCGSGVQRQIFVEVDAFNPVITQVDSVLTASEGLNYQWYRGNTPIPGTIGGNSRSLIVKHAGTYSVKVGSFSGCTRTTMPFVYNSSELCPNTSTTLTSNLAGNTYQWQVNTGNGFVDIQNNVYYSGVGLKSLKLSFIPSSWYGYQFRCLVDGSYSDTVTLKFSNVWTGAAVSSWEYGNNWFCGNAPDANTDVIIPSGKVIINSNVTCRSLTIFPNAQLIIMPGFKLTVRR